MVSFYWNAACRGTLHGFGDRVGIPEVVLMALPERFRVSRRYLLYVVTKRSQLAGNIVRCHAGFDADQALRHVYKSCGDPAASDLFPNVGCHKETRSLQLSVSVEAPTVVALQSN